MNVYGNPLKADPEEIVKLVIRSLFKMAIKKDPLQWLSQSEGIYCFSRPSTGQSDTVSTDF